MDRRYAMIICMLLGAVSTPGHAQLFLGRLGGACASLPDVPTLTLPLDAAVPAGGTLIVTVAVSSNFLSGLTVADPIGSDYRAMGGVQAGSRGSLVQFRAALQRPIPAGQDLELNFDNSGANISVCASVLAFSGLAFGNSVQETSGTASGNSATTMVTATAAGTTTRKLILAGWLTDTDPGAITPQTPANAQPALCTNSPSLCLVDAEYFDDPVGPATIGLSFSTAVNWSGVVSTILADGIFGNGFD